MMREESAMRIAVVTGATGGIGKEYVRQLGQCPDLDEIWAVARREEQLKKLSELTQRPVRAVALDLSEESSYQAFGDLLDREKPEIRYLVNNAGFGKFCRTEEVDEKTCMRMIDVNCKAVVALSLRALPYLTPGSHVINTASASAFQPLPYINLYGSTKVFVRNFSRALNREWKDRGISVTAVCPYWVKTDFFETAHQHEGNRIITKYEVLYDPRDVVEKALRDAGKGKDMSALGLLNKMQHVAAKLMPQSFVMNVWLRRQKL